MPFLFMSFQTQIQLRIHFLGRNVRVSAWVCARKVQGKYGIIWSIEQKGISHSGAENQFLRECYRKWLNIRSLVSREKGKKAYEYPVSKFR